MNRNNTKRIATSIIVTILAILLFIVVIVFKEKVEEHVIDVLSPSRKTYRSLTYNGEKYSRNDDITTLLIIGTDHVEGGSVYSQADFLAVLLINKRNKAYDIIQINRDTMTKVDVYSDLYGRYLRSKEMQITLSFAYGGNTDAKRAEHTLCAVENLLSLHINDFICFDIGSMKTLIEYVDGVTVTIPDDMTAVDPSLKKGEQITFGKNNSELALRYLRARSSLDEENNEKRMYRQKIFCEALIRSLKSKTVDYSFVKEGYDLLVESIQTNMNEREFVDYFTEFDNYEYQGTYFPQGRSNMDNEFVEYYVEADKLTEYVIEHCYKKDGR